jgi:hypothetical protein
MASKFAFGKRAFGFCDYCGFRYPLKTLKSLTIKTKSTNILVCPTCWTPDQPQLQLGMYPVNDPQALRNPRPDTTYWQSGLGGLQITPTDYGTPGGGSRVIQWGWAPVGLNDPLGLSGLENTLVMAGAVGTVSVTAVEVPYYLLLETGDFLLQEDGSLIQM